MRRASNSTSSRSAALPASSASRARRSGAGSAAARAWRRGHAPSAAAATSSSRRASGRARRCGTPGRRSAAAPAARAAPPTSSSTSRRGCGNCASGDLERLDAVDARGRVPPRSPAARSRRAKCMTFSASRPSLRCPSGSAAAAAFASVTRRVASSPAMRSRSSRYLSSTPRVLLTVSGSSVTRSSATSAVRPVDGLGDAGQLEEIASCAGCCTNATTSRESARRRPAPCGAGSRARASRRGSRPSGRSSAA